MAGLWEEYNDKSQRHKSLKTEDRKARHSFDHFSPFSDHPPPSAL
jgi:hypothetical protein